MVYLENAVRGQATNQVRYLPGPGLLFCPPLGDNTLSAGKWLAKPKRKIMKLSARNVLKGKVKSIKRGPISSLVVLEIAPKIEIVSTITAGSAATLRLKKGQTAYAIIKASSVLIGVDD